MRQEQPDDELITRLREVERARRRRAMLIGGLVALLAVIAIVGSFLFAETLFKPRMDVAGGEVEVIASTNDPECREFIAKITAVGRDYEELEPRLESDLLGDDTARVEARIGDLEQLKERIEAARGLAADANLRFDNSRAELDDWFAYVLNELTLLQNVGRERIASADDGDSPDVGTVVYEGREPKSKKSEKTVQERLDGATLAANEAFQKFRVWHTGGLHPCGPADEGEVPWKPDSPPQSSE